MHLVAWTHEAARTGLSSMETWVDRFKALADETRLMLLAALLDDELSVGELSEVIQAAQPGVSRHLQALSKAGLVTSRKQGTATLYRLVVDDPLLEGAFGEELRRAASHRSLAGRVEKIVAKRKQKSQAFFDAVDDWDNLRNELFDASVGFASLAPLVAPGMVIADIGTGTGGMLPYLADISAKILAVDLSQGMLRKARAKARSLGIEQVEFIQGDLAELPLEDNSVDAAFAALVLHHVARPVSALQEMRRIIRPGGSLVLIDLVSHGHEWLREEQADVWLGFSRDEIISLLERAGLHEPKFRVASRVTPRNGAPLELFIAHARKSVRGAKIAATGAHGFS